MSKTVSEIVTARTKVESLYDLLKPGFTIDKNDVPLIHHLFIEQQDRLEDRVLPPKPGRKSDKLVETQYDYDYSVFWALLLAHPMASLSQNTLFDNLNSTFESYVKEMIEFERTYLKKVNQPHARLLVLLKNDRAHLQKLEAQYDDAIKKFMEIKQKLMSDHPYSLWSDQLNELLDGAKHMLYTAVNDYFVSEGYRTRLQAESITSRRDSKAATDFRKKHPKKIKKYDAYRMNIFHCTPFVINTVHQFLE
jgi:hypothetical protein